MSSEVDSQGTIEVTKEVPQHRFFGLSQNVFVFGFVSMLTDFSSELTVKILPLFLANVLGVKPSIIGFIEGLAETAATLLKWVFGWLSDRLSRRKWLAFTGYGISSLSKPFLYFVSSWPGAAALRFLDRTGKGIRSSPKDALLADSSSKHKLGRSFGYGRSMDTLGSVFSMLAAAGIVASTGAAAVVLTRPMYQKLVLMATVPALVALPLIVFFVREIAPQHGPVSTLSLSLRGFDWRFKAFLAIMVVFTLGNSSDAFLLLRAQNAGLDIAQIFLMLAMWKGVTSALGIPAGILSDRIGRGRVIRAGWIIYAGVYLGFAFANKTWQIWGLYALYGVFYAMTEGIGSALVADLVPESGKRGTAFGLYNAAIGISALPASLIAGLLWQHVNPGAPFLFGAILAVVSVIAMTVLMSLDGKVPSFSS
ncbi:MAG: MFS transporter [Caldisericota bacterium]|nr:MFS transporter [Caldisericota bacterium]